MSDAKRVCLSSTGSLLCDDVLHNVDLYYQIVSFLRVSTIVKSLNCLSLSFYNYITINKKCIATLKKCISYDYGKIFKHPTFSRILKRKKKFENSSMLIKFYYEKLYLFYRRHTTEKQLDYVAYDPTETKVTIKNFFNCFHAFLIIQIILYFISSME